MIINDANATLAAALALFEAADISVIPVVVTDHGPTAFRLLGGLLHVDALKAYNKALAATAAEEHS